MAASCGTPGLPPGEYVLAVQTALRKCYSFCMCPGGRVVPAASEPFGVVINGMSDHARDGVNANAALCVPVGPEDFGSGDALAGVAFQRALEQAAFRAGGGAFRARRQDGRGFPERKGGRGVRPVQPSYERGVNAGRAVFAGCRAGGRDAAAGAAAFGRKVREFDAPGALLTGWETRTCRRCASCVEKTSRACPRRA